MRRFRKIYEFAVISPVVSGQLLKRELINFSILEISMSKYSKQSLFFLTAIAIVLAGLGLGVAVDKAESQSQSTVGCPDCPVSTSNPLHIRFFGSNGQNYTFGDTISPSEGFEIDPRLA